MMQDEYKKDFHSQKFCWVLDGKTFFDPRNAKQYIIDKGRSNKFSEGYLLLLRDEYYRNTPLDKVGMLEYIEHAQETFSNN